MSGPLAGYGRSPREGDVGLSRDLLQSFESDNDVLQGCAKVSGKVDDGEVKVSAEQSLL